MNSSYSGEQKQWVVGCLKTVYSGVNTMSQRKWISIEKHTTVKPLNIIC